MPRLVLLVPVCLALSLAAGTCAAQYQTYDGPPYRPAPYYPQYSAPYPRSYYAPPRYYPPRPYPDYRRQYPDYRQQQPYRDDTGRPYASYPQQNPYGRPPGPAYEQPRYPAYSPQAQSPDDRQPPAAAYEQPRYPAYSPPAPPAQAAQPQTFPSPSSPLTSAGSPQGQLLTPSQEGSRNLTTVAEAPLHDLNLVRQTIPQVLLTALADPYATPTPMSCDEFAAEIEDLAQALGPDYDADLPHRSKGVTESGGLGLSLMHSAAANLLPFHGYVSTLSGASKHDELVLRALGAGSARRAYLKGLGEARRCPLSAAPRHLDHAPIPIAEDSRKPYYPIR